MIDHAAAWDSRIAGLVARLPRRAHGAIDWLRHPGRSVSRRIAGVLFVLGGVFSILPILGLWMLPVGLALLAEDSPRLKARLERVSLWLERRWSSVARRAVPERPGPR